MTQDTIASGRNLGKAYRLFTKPVHRLQHALLGRASHQEFWALRGVNFELRRGETLGIIGENGAGKSTLLQMICGTLRPTEGDVAVRGRTAALLELGSGFNPHFTGRENVRLNAALLGLTKKEIDERFESIARFAGIGEFMDLPVKLYSSGMYARLAFSVVAHVDADLMIIDEILSVGDSEFRQRCTRFLERFRAKGSLLFVSHDCGTVASICERALWLEHGRVRELGAARDVCANYLATLAERDEAREAARQGTRAQQWIVPPAPDLVRDRRVRPPNSIVVQEFDPEAPWHGHGGARIEGAGFYSTRGERLSEIAGGDEVVLRVHCRAEREMDRPIVGFILRDRLGQNLLGDNTYLTHPKTAVASGEQFTAEFRFQLPFLPVGDYAWTLAITEGTQENHTHAHWIEEALAMTVVQSPIRRGVVGVPIRDIRVEAAGSVA